MELQAGRDVAARSETTITDVFSWDERAKPFSVSGEVKLGQKLTVRVPKLGPFEATSTAVLPAGFKTSVAILLSWADMNKKIVASELIKSGEKLELAVEA